MISVRSPDILRWSKPIRWARRCEPWQLNKRQAERPWAARREREAAAALAESSIDSEEVNN